MKYGFDGEEKKIWYSVEENTMIKTQLQRTKQTPV